MCSAKQLCVLLLILISNTIFSQPVIRLVKDIAQGSNGSEPQLFTVSNNQLFFAAVNESQKTFNKLWRTNGVEAGTMEVSPSSQIYVIQTPFDVNNKLLYWSNTSPSGGLYKTDGTPAGTQLLLSNAYSPQGAYLEINKLFNLNGKLFFAALHTALGTEPHITDGTPEGTFLLKDIYIGNNSSDISELTQVGSNLFFTAYNNLSGREIWRTDGTPSGTVQVIDLVPGSGSSLSYGNSGLTAFKDSLFFCSIEEGTHKLYKTNGSAEGTILVKSFYGGIHSKSLYVHNGSLYFLAAVDDDNYKLWKSDGTTEGTVPLTSSTGWFSTFKSIAFGDWLYFLYRTTATGVELWRTDGTEANTAMVKEIRAGTSDAFTYEDQLINVNGMLYFTANDGIHGKELWKSNGTAEGTVLVKDINPGAPDAVFEKPIVYQNRLYFVSNDADDLTRNDGWMTDGTENGTTMIKNLNPTLGLFDVRPEIVFQDKLYLNAKDDNSGSEVWMTDGSSINQLKEINTLPADAEPGKDRWGFPKRRFVGVNNTLFFSADNFRYGRELWMTKGTEGTTKLVKDFTKSPLALWYNSTNSDSYFNDMISYKNQLFVIVNGSQLWKIDENGNAVVLLQNSDLVSNYSGQFTLFKDKLYFRFGRHGSELWQTDGTVCTRVTGSFNLVTTLFASSNSLFFWTSPGQGTNTDLWKIDTVEGQPQKVKELINGYPDHRDLFIEINGVVFFVFISQTNLTNYDYRIWRTDGTADGTYLLKDINPGGNDMVRKLLTDNKSKVYFTATDGVNGDGIWTTDGTVQGTQLAIVMNPESSGVKFVDLFDFANGKFLIHSYVVNVPVPKPIYSSDGTQNGMVPITTGLFQVNNSFTHNSKNYFGVNNNLWETDASAAGTASIVNRSVSGTFEYNGNTCYQSHNGQFYFAAKSPLYGQELFVQEAEELSSFNIKDSPEQEQYIKYKASGPVTASNQLTNYSTNTYTSTKSVTFLPGFQTNMYANLLAGITNSTSTASVIAEGKNQLSPSKEIIVPSISQYELKNILSGLQNPVIVRAFNYSDTLMTTISITKEKLSNGQTRYTFVVMKEGKIYEESVETF